MVAPIHPREDQRATSSGPSGTSASTAAVLGYHSACALRAEEDVMRRQRVAACLAMLSAPTSPSAPRPSIRSAARTYNLPKSTVHRLLQQARGNSPTKRRRLRTNCPTTAAAAAAVAASAADPASVPSSDPAMIVPSSPSTAPRPRTGERASAPLARRNCVRPPKKSALSYILSPDTTISAGPIAVTTCALPHDAPLPRLASTHPAPFHSFDKLPPIGPGPLPRGCQGPVSREVLGAIGKKTAPSVMEPFPIPKEQFAGNQRKKCRFGPSYSEVSHVTRPSVHSEAIAHASRASHLSNHVAMELCDNEIVPIRKNGKHYELSEYDGMTMHSRYSQSISALTGGEARPEAALAPMNFRSTHYHPGGNDDKTQTILPVETETDTSPPRPPPSHILDPAWTLISLMERPVPRCTG